MVDGTVIAYPDVQIVHQEDIPPREDGLIDLAEMLYRNDREKARSLRKTIKEVINMYEWPKDENGDFVSRPLIMQGYGVFSPQFPVINGFEKEDP